MTELDTLTANLAHGMSLAEMREKMQRDPYKARAPRPQEALEAERAYWDTVWNTEPRRLEGLRFGRAFEQEMSYDEARKRFWAAMQMQAAHVAMRENRPDFEYTIDADLARNLRAIVKWAINDPTGEIPITKGLFLFGQTGTGKSDMIEVLARFASTYSLAKQFTITQMSDVYTRAREDKDYQPVQDCLHGDRAFDEFGRHTGPVMRYGDPLDISEAVVEARYNRFKRYGQLSHFVANMTPNECSTVFSPVVFDRIRHMCHSIHFTGESRRR
jgi:DNA replication protein DnaC